MSPDSTHKAIAAQHDYPVCISEALAIYLENILSAQLRALAIANNSAEYYSMSERRRDLQDRMKEAALLERAAPQASTQLNDSDWAAGVPDSGERDARSVREPAGAAPEPAAGQTPCELIEEIETLEQKATKGEWFTSYVEGAYEIIGKRWRIAVLYATDEQKTNAELIVALRNAWPQIRDAIRALKATTPDGVIVPREPTNEMLYIGLRQLRDAYSYQDGNEPDRRDLSQVRDCYLAMLTAAQEKP